MKPMRLVLINIAVLIGLLSALEIAARAYVAATRGSQIAGLQERTVYLSYEPFVMYGPQWDRALAPSRWPRHPGACRVLLLGGSTATGFPLSVLQQSLEVRVPGRSFEVINAAQGGYETRQEAIIAALWGPALEPDVLLSLDGANDLEHRLRVDKAGEFYLSPTYAVYLTRPWVAPLALLLTNSQLYNGLVRLVERRSLHPSEHYADAIAVYVEAQHSINMIAKGMGATRVMVLQPFSAYKTPLSSEEAAFQLYKYREEVMKALYDRASQQLAALATRDAVQYVDGRYIYRGDRERIFIDDVHLTARGYKRLADVIATEFAGEARKSRCMKSSASG